MDECKPLPLARRQAVALGVAPALETLGHARVGAVGLGVGQDLSARRHDSVPQQAEPPWLGLVGVGWGWLGLVVVG